MPNFRSKLEGKVNDLLQLNRVDYKYESKKIPYTLTCNYIPDFILASGVILEVKGYLDSDDKRKMIAVKEVNPELDIRFVFQSPYSKIPRTQMTHARWAEKHGFPWCHYQQIPPEWLKNSQRSTTTATIEGLTSD